MKDYTILKMQHSSLQFSDTSEQQRKDVEDLFSKGEHFPIKTGTEAGPDEPSHNMNRTILRDVAAKYQHNLHFAGDNWIAVDKEIVKRGSFKRDQVFIADNDESWGRGHDTVLAVVTFEHVESGIGQLGIGAAHYPVRGAQPGDPNYKINQRYAARAGAWMAKVAQGRSLAFLNGDFNMNDIRTDWDFKQSRFSFTSMGDELNKHPNTGHGPIDGFCSFDADARVSAEFYRVLDDKDFFQFSDHFVCRGGWKVKHRS